MKKSAIFVLCAGLMLAFTTAVRAADEAAVTQQLQSLGGKVTVKDGSVSQVEFKDCSKLGDAEFRAIGQLTHLKSLTLYGKCQGLTDATIVHLAGLKELESIGTDGVKLTDDGLKHFAALKNLKSAAFFHTSFGTVGFTGVGFGALKDCPKLEKLTVAGISMGDEGFAAIAGIKQLRELRTWHTYQTEAGNAEITKLPNLQTLRLGQRLPHAKAKPSLTEASLATLVTIKSLENLQLGEAHFTVDGLKALKQLPKLKQLSFFETDLTQADVEKLKSELPGVKFDFQPLTDEQKKKFESYLKQ